jgi:predicted transposase YbfD/YdcC
MILALAAILSNQCSVLAIAEWGTAQSEEMKRALGFQKGITPHQSTTHRVLRRLDPKQVEEAFHYVFLLLSEAPFQERGECALAIDGKAQRGRLNFEEEDEYTVHTVSICDHQTGIVLTQGHVAPSPKIQEKKEEEKRTQQEKNGKREEEMGEKKKTQGKKKRKKSAKQAEAEKAASELALAPFLLEPLDWKNKVLTGDALYCQRALCRFVRKASGDYLFLVKGNQPLLLEEIRVLFALPEEPKHAGEGMLFLPEEHFITYSTGHGRWEMRTIRVSSELKGHSDWPGLEQVFQIRRRWKEKGQWHESLRYGVTSLPATIATPERLLQLKRGHWTIENGLHYVKDVTMGEDKSLVHADQGPKILSALRNTVIGLLRHAGFHTIASSMRYNSSHPEAALAVLTLTLFLNA